MRPRKVPLTSLSHSLVVPHTRETRRLFTRLSKVSLLALAKRWLDPEHVKHFSPNLVLPPPDDEEELSLEEAQEVYADFEKENAIRAKDVAERMLEMEWRDGATLLAIAELEWQYLIDHPSSSKWQSFLLSPLSTSHTPLRPRFYTPTFLSTLQSSLKPLQTAHFFSALHPSLLSLTVLRISLHSPYTPPSYPPTKRSSSIFFLAFPSGSDHVFTTLGASNTDGLRDSVLAAIAHAVSRPHCRFALKPGRFVAKTLESLCSHRGAGDGAGGLGAGWSVYLDGFESSPLAVPRVVQPEDEDGEEGEERKRRKMVKARFGATGVAGDGRAVESAYFEVDEMFPSACKGKGKDVFRPTIGVRLMGAHVFAGVRAMAEKKGGGAVVEKLPGWMLGEEGVTSGIIRNRKLLRKMADGKFSKA
ncbi:centromere protein Chl4/mis15/CENP-N [Tricharina praecox]|uniref:centromere protein Chl4/mis15/CENP-N n=1 Tax=Tricharina praecox TaxID=43433 RepID=UPI00221F726E|nr:centromere protein Chl4/mis15/CENP-N [Tricharina praecox]KAI5856424.1 centromere protein Chl4/mis15/CENP-N [Tricharina praecox]